LEGIGGGIEVALRVEMLLSRLRGCAELRNEAGGLHTMIDDFLSVGCSSKIDGDDKERKFESSAIRAA
jgi:hypothetical protein